MIWDSEQSNSVIYIDVCIEQINGAVDEIVGMFNLTNYTDEYDEHYVCPDCIENILED